jgi:hypothetical protein
MSAAGHGIAGKARRAVPGGYALAVACAAWLAMNDAHAVSGSYSSEAAGPVMHSRKVWYTAVHPPVGSPPRKSKITTVSWRWGLSAHPRGLEVKLCYRSATDCVPVTAYGKAMTQAFAGRPADGPFLLMFRVEGTGRMPPINGERSQVIVNYVY